MRNKLIRNSSYLENILPNYSKNLIFSFNEKFGIINSVLERNELKKYGLHMYQCLSADMRKLYDISSDVSSGGLGVSSSKDIALISCLSEALERYCMSSCNYTNIIHSFNNELPKDLRFNDFYFYSDEQYRQNSNRFTNPKTDKIHWTKIINIMNDTDFKYYPASQVYLPFDKSKVVCETSSTGVAAGFSIESCIENGLLELIERDALMINFTRRLNPPEIDLNTISGNNQKKLSVIQRKFNVKIYKLYTDIDVPVFLGLIWKKSSGKVHYGIGACANLDSNYAIDKCLRECLFTHFYSKKMINLRENDPDKIDTLYNHFLYYQGENFQQLLFNSEIEPYVEKKVSYEQLKKSLIKNGIDCYYVDMTTLDIEKTKLKVVRVIAPKLIDLNKTHILPRMSADRFWAVPKKLNISCDEGLSKMPHPFP